MIARNDLARHHAPLRSELGAAMARVKLPRLDGSAHGAGLRRGAEPAVLP